MNCHQFQSHVADLARGETMDATVRELALTHANECTSCAVSLADQRALSAGLAALRAITALESGSESAVMAAFRARTSFKPRPASRLRRVAGAAAVAAAVVLIWQAVAPKPVPPPAKLAATRPAARTPVIAAKAVRPEPPAPAVRRVKRKGRPAQRVEAPQVETATEFMAIPYSPAWTQDDRGQVVRVRLPRASLRSFGLPVSEDRFFEKVQADVLLGEDGIARAVRFVSNRQ